MKSRFEFTALKKDDTAEAEGDEGVFFAMLDVVEHGHLILHTENISEAFNLLPDGRYWIAQNVVAYKGRKRWLAGRMARASKEAISDFLVHLTASGDLRDFVLYPAFEDFALVLFVTDEGVFLLYEKRGS